MKRTIKFRAKATTGEWMHGQLFVVNSEPYILPNGFGEGGIGKFKVQPETIGQFIGLTDKYGREIYEDDLLNIHDSHETIGEVAWFPNDVKFGLDRIVKDGKDIGGKIGAAFELYGYKCKQYEVIGNVYDTMLYALPQYAELKSEYGDYYETHIKASLRAYFGSMCPDWILNQIETVDGQKYPLLRINDTADENAMLEFWVYQVRPNLLTLGYAGRIKG